MAVDYGIAVYSENIQRLGVNMPDFWENIWMKSGIK